MISTRFPASGLIFKIPVSVRVQNWKIFVFCDNLWDQTCSMFVLGILQLKTKIVLYAESKDGSFALKQVWIFNHMTNLFQAEIRSINLHLLQQKSAICARHKVPFVNCTTFFTLQANYFPILNLYRTIGFCIFFFHSNRLTSLLDQLEKIWPIARTGQPDEKEVDHVRYVTGKLQQLLSSQGILSISLIINIIINHDD